MAGRLALHCSLGTLATILACGATAPAFAQDTGTPEPAGTGTAQNPAQVTAPPDNSQEIVITATRHADLLSRVPASVTAVTGEALQQRHIETIEDIAHTTPGVVFQNNTGSGVQRNSAITIRGIAAVNGAATVGVYLDDTPMTIRNIATGATNNFYPALFDLDRIEVLRGPQGTLFGAGSEGGTIRFIGSQPSVDTWSAQEIFEGAGTKGGSASGQAGVAVGGPIVDGKIGFRVSGYWRHEGGFVDKYNFNSGALIERNANYDDTYSGRIALLFKPTDQLEITPSLYVQHLRSNDYPRIIVPTVLNTIAGMPSAPHPVAQGYGDYSTEPNVGKDDFQIASLNVHYDFGPVTATSITSYLHRVQNETDDLRIWVQLFDGAGDPFVPGAPNYTAPSPDRNWAKSFTQELRLASNYKDSPLTWVAGLYYSHVRQDSNQWVYSQNFADLVTLPGLGPFFASLVPAYVQGQSFDVHVNQGTTDVQEAAYGQVDYKILRSLTATVGLRVERDTGNFYHKEAGPVGNGANGPAFQNYGPTLSAREASDAVIPKFGLSWQVDPRNMFYATVAKGFRPGGQNTVNTAVTTPNCAAGLHELGLSQIPQTYNSDSVWSYEVGAKNRWFGGHVAVDASAFYIKWDNVQQAVNIGCTTAFTANLGKASSRGFDLSVDLNWGGLSAGADVAYTDARFDQSLRAGALYVAKAGDPLPNILPWTVSVHGEYHHRVAEGVDGYVRADWQWLDHEPKGDPLVVGWDPTTGSNGTYAPNPAYGILNMRVGVRTGPADLSVFALNLTNEKPHLNYGRDFPLVSAVYKYSILRPFTAGVTATFHF